MSKYRNGLPQLSNQIFLTDGGLETTLVFLGGWKLPMFEAFTLLETQEGTAALLAYYETYVRMAADRQLGFVLETPTWRANPDWAAKVGVDRPQLAAIVRASVELMQEVRWNHERRGAPIVISGNIGPRGDGYVAETAMSVAEAADYHAWQIGVFRDTAVDLVSAFTMTSSTEALGVARAAAAHALPCAIAFTLETDGRLPSGERLAEAVGRLDADTGCRPAYYMVNCAHPSHFSHVLERGAPWTARIRGIRANASTRSHQELDAAPDLDRGDPHALGRAYAELRRHHPHMTILGGCCGTDHEHVEEISLACAGVAA